jgi:peptidoglycan/xylan/chitin deacetylase (PgdA/CDA1 family)
MKAAMPAKVGYFTVSFDFELIWGTLDTRGVNGFGRACTFEREVIIDRLLALLAKYEIPATWFVVGHLMLDHCDPEAQPKHPGIVRPRHAWRPGDWFDRDPGGDETSSPLFFARSLIGKLRASSPAQEIGCHSFSHVIFGDAGCSTESAESELAECVRAAGDLGLTMKSFAFPRNRVGHIDALARNGFTAYRGPEPQWYSRARRLPRALVRAAHFSEFIRTATPSIVWPVSRGSGLVDVPGSMVFLPRHGMRRVVSVDRRVRRAVKGLEAAARRSGLFHLWMHPTNLADDSEAMLGGLERTLAHAAKLRSAGLLRMATVTEMATLAQAGRR